MDLMLPPRKVGENNKEYAHRVLRKNIMNLYLKPGEILNEPALAGALEMSRTPVHEAIAALHEDWLIDIYPQKGTRVSRIDPNLVKEGYQARLLLEGSILREGAGKFGRDQIQEMLNCIYRQDELQLDEPIPEKVDLFLELDDEFHHLMYVYSGKVHTWQAIRGLVAHYDRLRYLDALNGTCEYERVKRQHREFCDYLLMGMPEGINPEQKVYEHMLSFRGDLIQKSEMYPGFFTLDQNQE